LNPPAPPLAGKKGLPLGGRLFLLPNLFSMKKIAFAWLVAQSLTSPIFAQPNHPNTTGAGWKPLFAADLSDASFEKGIWTVENGVLTASEDKPIWTRKPYKNCVIDLEFRNATGTNSGVFVYCNDPKNFVPNSVEIQIADDYDPKWANSPKSWQCGAFFGHQPATRQQVVRRPGEWNHYTITCRDKKIEVALNGEVVNRFDLSQFTSTKKNPDGTDVPAWLSRPANDLNTEGLIGLQGKHAGAPIYFRNLKVKEL
jgi:hypothetical protein